MGRIIAFVLLIPIVYFGAILAASEWGGEVVTLETQDSAGRYFETSVWIVDFDRGAWLRAGNPDSDWVTRIGMVPNVFVTRAGERVHYRARVIDGMGKRVNQEMRIKYGYADQLVGTLHDGDNVVGIRLDRG